MAKTFCRGWLFHRVLSYFLIKTRYIFLRPRWICGKGLKSGNLSSNILCYLTEFLIFLVLNFLTHKVGIMALYVIETL